MGATEVSSYWEHIQYSLDSIATVWEIVSHLLISSSLSSLSTSTLSSSSSSSLSLFYLLVCIFLQKTSMVFGLLSLSTLHYFPFWTFVSIVANCPTSPQSLLCQLLPVTLPPIAQIPQMPPCKTQNVLKFDGKMPVLLLYFPKNIDILRTTTIITKATKIHAAIKDANFKEAEG